MGQDPPEVFVGDARGIFCKRFSAVAAHRGQGGTMSLNLALLLRESAKAHPEKTALAVGDRRLTYEALDLDARLSAGGLRALGSEPGQHVAILVPNAPHFTIAHFAA